MWHRLRAAVLVLCSFPPFAACTAVAPNILFLMADQLRFDYVQQRFTPHLAQLAARGLTLRNAYTATPSCTPARSALLTGLSPWYNGMLGYGALPLAWPLEMPRAMAELGGYRTASIGKNHFLPDGWPANVTPPSHGWGEQFLYDGLGDGMGSEEFDAYDKWFREESNGADPLASGGLDWNSWRGAPYKYPEAWHPTAWVARTAVAWLANYSAGAGAPFFLKVSWHRPHSPYVSSARSAQKQTDPPPPRPNSA
jgi:arylsulfatase